MLIQEGRLKLSTQAILKNGPKGQYLDACAEIPARRNSEASPLLVGVRAFGEAAEALVGKQKDTFIVFRGRLEVELWDGKVILRVVILQVYSADEPTSQQLSSSLCSLAAKHHLNGDTF